MCLLWQGFHHKQRNAEVLLKGMCRASEGNQEKETTGFPSGCRAGDGTPSGEMLVPSAFRGNSLRITLRSSASRYLRRRMWSVSNKMAQRYNNSAGHTNKSFVYAVMQGLCGPATEKSGCAHLYYSFSSNKSVSSSQALMREPATVSFTSYHFPVSTLPGRVTNRFLLSPIVCSIACCVLPSQPKFSQQ